MAGYLASFAIGLAGTVAVGLAIWVITDVPLASSVGNTIFFYGIVVLFVGGVAGGGYTQFGSGRTSDSGDGRRPDHDGRTSAVNRRTDVHDRVPQRKKPGANPKALWQVAGGALYIAIGVLIVVMWS